MCSAKATYCSTINSFALHPRKAKELIASTALSTQSSEATVKEVTDFYWQEVRKNLSSLSQPRIHVTNLGDFVVKHWKIQDKLLKMESFSERFKQKGMQELVTRFRTAETIYDLKKLMELLEQEAQRKEFIKMHKSNSNGQ